MVLPQFGIVIEEVLKYFNALEVGVQACEPACLLIGQAGGIAPRHDLGKHFAQGL